MSPRTRIIAGVLSVLLVFVALGAYFFERYVNKERFNPAGTLLLSLASVDSAEVNLYEYDISTKELRRVGRNGNSNYDGSIAPDGNRIAHIAYGPRALASQVVVYDPLSGERRPITKGEAFRRAPDWSPIGSKLAFFEERKGESEIYVSDVLSSPIKVGFGEYPHWSMDGESLFALSKEGLVRYDLSDSASLVKIWGARGAGMKLASSRDHSLLAWLIPSANEIRLFKVNKLKPKELLFNKVLSVRAYDAVFSPDNSYVAYRVLVEEGGSTHFEIEIEKLDTGERESVLDLSAYERNSLYLSDWK